MGMKILILETSTEKGSLILAEDGQPLAVKTLPGGPELSKNLAAEVEKRLEELKEERSSEERKADDEIRIAEIKEEIGRAVTE